MPMPRKADPEKYCAVCGVRLERKRYSGTLEDMGRFMLRRTCGQSCGNSRAQVTKSALHWRAKKYRKAACESCGTSANLHVHHRDKNVGNNDPANLQTLCGSCHLKWHWANDRRKAATL